MLNLILGIAWLATGLGLLVYERVEGPVTRIAGLNVSMGWFMLVLAAWNFARWYLGRAWRAEQKALRIAHEARLRQARYHERPVVPDPNFDFSDKPRALGEPPQPNITDQPPNPGEPGKSAP